MVAGLAVAAALAVQSLPRPDSGLGFVYQDGQVVVASVDYGSGAQRELLQPGQIVTWLDWHYVFGASDQVKREIAGSRGSWTQVVTIQPYMVAEEQASLDAWVKSASGSSTPWLADPATQTLPGCGQDPACTIVLPSEFAYQPPTASVDTTEYGTYAGYDEATANPIATICSSRTTVNFYPTGDYLSGSSSYFVPYATRCVQSKAPFYTFTGTNDWTHMLDSSGPPMPAAQIAFLLVLMSGGWYALRRGWAGPTLKVYAASLPVAVGAPLFVWSIDRYPSLAAVAVGAVLLPLAMLPLAIDFLSRIEGTTRRRLAASVAAGFVAASVFAGSFVSGTSDLVTARIVTTSLITLVPGLFAAWPLRATELAPGSKPRLWREVFDRILSVAPNRMTGRLRKRPSPARPSASTSAPTPAALMESADTLFAAVTPSLAAFCLNDRYSADLGPLVVWLIAAPLVLRLVIRPTGRLATAARRQRDLVVAATEAERVRIAADIHDDALQDLTMLVRRLDAAGDTANAQAAREVADRLRAICGDLRLPVLDDLGVGPALEWLCGRLGGDEGNIELDRLMGEGRLPDDVELAVFRIAQEALSNAIRHGASPISVRYRTRPGWVELVVDDSGTGMAEGAARLAEQAGRLGLLNMNQRAEAIGAALRIEPRPGGGTRVSLVWAKATAPSGAAVPAPA